MMTSVTLPSSSGANIHGGFEAAGGDFEPPRPPKRCLSTPPADACKKRRKQATPVRIAAGDDGKTASTPPPPALVCKQEPADSPPPDADASDASECSQPDGAALAPLGLKQELPPWLPELPAAKEWMSPSLLGFPAAANSLFMGLPAFAAQPDALPPRQPIRIFNPDAYCELCNKEFCNKYFLKTHKANKHGIYSDPPADANPAGCSSTPASMPSYGNSMKLPGMPTSLDLAVKMEKSYDMFPFGKMFGKADALASELGADADQPPTQTHTQIQVQSQEESSIQNETTSNASASEQEAFYTSPVKLSPSAAPGPPPPPQPRESYQDLSARLRRIGVMNPKAFCEICCKEYCNKYFLRTHKMKRHGIFIPDERDKDKDAAHPYTQTSPLNLIMGEQSSNSSDRKTSSPSDISCETCGIKFQNASLFQLHNVSVHAKLPDPPQLHSETAIKKQPEDKPTSANSSSADSISEDLQKLQTMILQLNDLDVSKVAATCSTCATCGKDFENRYYLHAHMMTEHGLLLDDPAEHEKAPETPDANSNINNANLNNNTICELCGKDFPNVEDMKKHLYEAHKTAAGGQGGGALVEVKEEFNGFTTPEKTPRGTPAPPPAGERRSSMNLTPTSSYCEICNKELCNKYFMKTHMQRMHGIEIENGAQIGGVICDICNKELCSKYFLRVHKHNTHGIVEYGSNLLQPKRFDDASSATPPGNMPAPSGDASADTSLKPGDLQDMSHRYFSHFNEVCSICARRFRSTKWLKAHLLSDHGQAGAEKWAELEQQLQQTMKSSGGKNSPTIKVPGNQNQAQAQAQQQQHQAKMQTVLSSIFGSDAEPGKTYHCSYCPFTTPVLPFLFVHERSHSLEADAGAGALKCPVCMQLFSQPEQLQHHVFTQHPFLPLPPFFNGFGAEDGEEEEAPSKASKKAPALSHPLPLPLPLPQPQAPPQPAKRPSPAQLDGECKAMARKAQLPAAYALPQLEDEAPSPYVMQPFLLEESANVLAVPAIVYLPVPSRLSAPITATFTLTPA